MCGICGKLFVDAERRVDRELIARMCSVLHHRGPDDEGVYCKGAVGLGHRRLSILDLSRAGRQPMSNEDGTVWLVCNGEIYNYPQLRQELIERGHTFSSRTDTETIIHLYEERGIDCLAGLRGMFSFALWDSVKRRLLLARDRAGQKPLVYFWDGRQLVFASELKSLLQDDTIERSIDPLAIHYYLTYQYVPAPRTMFGNVRKLPPAHYMIYESGQAAVRRYWDLSASETCRYAGAREYREHFFQVFGEAVRMRLHSDVPFGAFLSGGVDSSLVVSLMSGFLAEPVKTFSIGFKEQQYNELPYARIVADAYGTDHHEFVVEPDVVSILPGLVWQYNEPFADSSAIPTYMLSQMTRRHVTMALSGDGCDECFAGYERYRQALRRRAVLGIPAPLWRAARKALGRISAGRRYRSPWRRLHRYAARAGSGPESRYLESLYRFDPFLLQELYAGGFAEQCGGCDASLYIHDLFKRARGCSFLDKLLYVDSMSYLPEDLLVKIDMASMAHSLEVRSPFVDHVVMECAAAAPAEMKIKNGQTKYILKQIVKDRLPRPVVFRKKKGFAIPLEHWFRSDLREMMYDVLCDRTARCRGYFDPECVRMLLDEHCSATYDHSSRIWTLLCLELWHRIFIDKSVTPPERPAGYA